MHIAPYFINLHDNIGENPWIKVSSLGSFHVEIWKFQDFSEYYPLRWFFYLLILLIGSNMLATL